MTYTPNKNDLRDMFKYLGITDDKTQHFIVGAIIAGSVSLIGYPETGLGIAVGAGIIMEIVDYMDNNPNTAPDIWDAVATAGGGLAVYVAIKTFL